MNYVYIALTIQMNERLAGREPAIGPSLQRALRVFPTVSWGSDIELLHGAVRLAASRHIRGAIAAGVIELSESSLGSRSALLIGIGGIALPLILFLFVRIIPPLMFYYPAIIAEHLTGYRSIKRAFALARKGQDGFSRL